MPATGPLRRTRPLVTAVTILIVAVLAAAVWITRQEVQVQRSVYTEILDEKLEATRREFRLFLQPFQPAWQTLDSWRASGVLDAADPLDLERLVVPLVAPSRQIALVAIVPDEGPETVLVRADDRWRAYTDDPAVSLRGTDWHARVAAAGADSGANWSGYLPLPGVGATGLVMGRRSGDLVIGLGLREDALEAFTAGTPVTERGILVRRFADGSVAWLAPRLGNRLAVATAADLQASAVPEHGIIGQALLGWGQAGRPLGESLRFRHEGATWWATFYDQGVEADPGEMGLILPDADLAARLESSMGTVTVLLIAVVVLAMVVVVTLAFGYRNRWRRVARRRLDVPVDDSGLAALIAGGEGDRLEFKSTMRWNLRAGKPGKEIELAWLKSVVAFLNTDGGIILLGVDDDGTVLGLAADAFRNEDKCLLHFENLINGHVGLEHAARIHGSLRTVGEHRIMLVAVERGDEAVFLRHGDAEDFYIRVGPSSRKLPASRVVDYMKERQA